MEQNYLDIYPTNSIARHIEAEPLDPRWHDQLIAHTNAYIKVMEHENLDFLESRQGLSINEGDTYKFLRSQERTRYTKLILQYLISFLSKLPLEADIKGDLANPFDQLKTFLINSIGLLKEKDVAEAILKEHKNLGLLNDTNAWYYRGQIDKNYKNLCEAVQIAEKPNIKGYRQLFRAVQRICVFWFSVRNEVADRVRKSDILMYKLARFLLAKYGDPGEKSRV
ncbi:MAG: hypothetical protein GY940_45475 [bacterium]|nr:hypothetical protein [bacterium]